MKEETVYSGVFDVQTHTGDKRFYEKVTLKLVSKGEEGSPKESRSFFLEFEGESTQIDKATKIELQGKQLTIGSLLTVSSIPSLLLLLNTSIHKSLASPPPIISPRSGMLPKMPPKNMQLPPRPKMIPPPMVTSKSTASFPKPAIPPHPRAKPSTSQPPTPIAIPQKGWAKKPANQSQEDRVRSVNMMGRYRGEERDNKETLNEEGKTPPQSPKKKGKKLVSTLSANSSSFLKRKQLSRNRSDSSSEKSSSKPKSPTARTRTRASSSRVDTFFNLEIRKAREHNEEGTVALKTIRVNPKYDSSIYVTQILLSDSTFKSKDLDKSLVPKQIARTIKLLGGALDKKWLLCSIVPWDDLSKIPDLHVSGVKKGMDPYLASEFLVSLVRNISPLLVFDNFDPEESFLDISGDEEKENKYITELIQSQTEERRSILGTLINFLKSSLKSKKENGLDRTILSKIYGPFLVSPQLLSYKKTHPGVMKSTLVL